MSSGTDDLPKVDSRVTDFMALVGHCITDWATIEEELFKIIYDILDVTEEQAAIIYLRTPTLESRLSLIDELVRTAFPKPERKNGGHQHRDLDAWVDLIRDIRDLLPIRNQLAHSPVGAGIYGFVDQETDAVTEVLEIRVQSYAHYHEEVRKPEGKKPLEIADLIGYRPQIVDVSTRLFHFRNHKLKAQLRLPR